MSYDKNYKCDLCKPIHDIINYSTFICSFESGKCEKKGKNTIKIEYLKNIRNFLEKIKSIFIVFEWISFGKETQKTAGFSFSEWAKKLTNWKTDKRKIKGKK